MEETAKKVLFVNSEIFPYLPETDIARIGEELRMYKSLLDEGVITEEEFTSKKKQLMGL